MANQICIPSNHFILVIIIGAAIIGWALYQVNQQAQQLQAFSADKIDDMDTINQNLDEIIKQRIAEKMPNNATNQFTYDLTTANQRHQDYQRMINPFVPPVQRGPFSASLSEKTLPINIPSRGEYGGFQQVGYAYKPNDHEQMFQLFGRRIHSNKYEYYVVHPITQIKMPIKVKNDYELNKDDIIVIKGFQGDFKVEIYDLDQPRYVPY